jgi:hypothetical protein
LIERFQMVLAEEVQKRGGPTGTWAEARRELELKDYLGLFLFGLFNPVVETMRGLCEASELARVQREVCGRAVSLGSFSEAQAVVDAELLKAVLQRLAAEADTPERPRGFTGRERICDSSVWRVVPRMTWAFWRRQGGLDNAVRLHVALDAATGQISEAKLTKAKTCERAQWREFARPGTCDIADRYYSYDYKQLAELQAAGTDFVVRLRVDAHWVEENGEILTTADRAAGVSWASTVRLGEEGNGPRVRVIAILGEKETILVATTLPCGGLPAGNDRAVLQAPLASGDVFSLAEVHPGLPEMAGRERTGRRLAGVPGADRRTTAGAVSRRAAQSPADGGHPILSDWLGDPGRTDGQVAAQSVHEKPGPVAKKLNAIDRPGALRAP